jgi:hypothetical protein
MVGPTVPPIGGGGKGKVSCAWAFTRFVPNSIRHDALAHAAIFFLFVIFTVIPHYSITIFHLNCMRLIICKADIEGLILAVDRQPVLLRCSLGYLSGNIYIYIAAAVPINLGNSSLYSKTSLPSASI